MAMTKQEIFNKVVTGLLKQGCQSKDEMGDCSYRGKDGTKCAVGMLIDDEHYNDDLEGRRAAYERVQEALMKSGVIDEYMQYSDEDMYFLECMQDVHDEWDPEYWNRRFSDLAVKFGLEMVDGDIRDS